MMTMALNLLKPFLEILLILWAAFAVVVDLLAQLRACLSVFLRAACDAASLRRAKTLLFLGGVLQWISCALLDFMRGGQYAFGVTAFLLMADTLISMPVTLIVSFGQTEGAPGDFFWVKQLTGLQYLLSVLFCFSFWLSLLWMGDGETMTAQLVGSIHQFAAFFMFAALGAAVIAIIASFLKQKDATSTARQALTSCFVFGLILFLLEWLFS